MEWVGLVDVLHTAPHPTPLSTPCPSYRSFTLWTLMIFIEKPLSLEIHKLVLDFKSKEYAARMLPPAHMSTTHYPPTHRQLRCPLQLIVHVNASQGEGHYNRAEPFSSDQLLTVSGSCCQ